MKKRPAVARIAAPLVAALLATACRHVQPPQPFAASAAFHKSSGVVYGIQERDLDGDGLEDAVVAERVGPGYAPAIYRQRAAEPVNEWDRTCEGPVVEGAELDVLRLFTLKGTLGGTLVLLVASDETPDEVVQSFLILSTSSCKVLQRERVALPRPPDAVIGPGPVAAGVVLAEDGSLSVTDEPEALPLDGPDGTVVHLLLSVRRRTATGTAEELAWEERRDRFLASRSVQVRFATPDGVFERPELTDDEVSASFVLRPGETGTLTLSAEREIAALELLHGCTGAPAVALELGSGDGPSYTTGERPRPGSFVQGVGRGHHDQDGVRRDLLGLAKPTAELSLTVVAHAEERCLREVKAYGFH